MLAQVEAATGVAPTGVIYIVLQFGAIGLLSYIVWAIVAIMPKRLEKADELAEKEAESRVKVAEELRKTAEAQAAAYIQANKESLAAYAEQARYEREDCNRRSSEQMERWAETHEVVREVKHEVANLAQSL